MKKGVNRLAGPVYVVCGSASDQQYVAECAKIFTRLGISYRITIASAHRTPEKVEEFIRSAEDAGAHCIIAMAGFAAHLPGVIASRTFLPVVGVPLDTSSLLGIDALLSIVQMPGGIPVASTGIGKAGARNAALFAAQWIAAADRDLREKLIAYRNSLKEEVAEANRACDL